MSVRVARKLIAAIAILAACALPCQAQSKLLKSDHSHDILRLEAFTPLPTWEQDGVRVYVAEQGAMVRQGPVQLTAPKMVVWFEVARSADPQVRRAIVRVYAEGTPNRPVGTGTKVSLVEGKDVQQANALVMTFTSSFSFVVDSPLTKSDKPVPGSLARRAEPLLKGTQDETFEEIPPAVEPSPFETVTEGLKADHVEVFWDTSTAVYMGDVHGGYGDLVVRADAAVLWYNSQLKTYEIYAEGNVRVSRKAGAKLPEPKPTATFAEGSVQVVRSKSGSRMAEGKPEKVQTKPSVTDVVELARADQMYINPGRARGLAVNAEMRLADPKTADMIYVFRGKEAYLIDQNTMTIRDVHLTTSDFAVPGFQVAGQRAQVISRPPSTVLNIWDPKFQLGQEPKTLVSLPFIGTDLTQRAYLLESYAIGSSKKFGFLVQTTWRPLDLSLAPPTWVENWLVNLDYYAARGPAIGTELSYKFGPEPFPHTKGTLNAFFIEDSGTKDVSTGQPVPQTQRGLVHLRQRTQINEDWRIDAELYWISDKGLLQEYFDYNFANEKVPETYLLGRYLHDSTYLALLLKPQVNSFIRDVEQLPSADLQVIGLPLGRFVYQGQASAGLFNLQPSTLLTPAAPDPPAIARFHTQQELSLPFMLSIFRIDPSLRVLATWASEGVDKMGDFGGTPSRTGAGAGVTASTTLDRVYDVTNDTLDLHRLRHIITPFVDLQTLGVGGTGSDGFIQMDQIDTIDTTTQATIGVRQLVQTKRLQNGQWKPVDWIDAVVAYVSQSSDSVDPALGASYLMWDVNVLLSDRVSVHSWDNQVGAKTLPDIINAGITFDLLPQWTLGLDYDSISNIGSVLTADLFTKLSERYQLILRQQFRLSAKSGSLQGNSNMRTLLVLRRLLHGWVLDVGVNYDPATSNFGVIFGFGPAGWGAFKNTQRPGRY